MDQNVHKMIIFGHTNHDSCYRNVSPRYLVFSLKNVQKCSQDGID